MINIQIYNLDINLDIFHMCSDWAHEGQVQHFRDVRAREAGTTHNAELQTQGKPSVYFMFIREALLFSFVFLLFIQEKQAQLTLQNSKLKASQLSLFIFLFFICFLIVCGLKICYLYLKIYTIPRIYRCL